jgi:opacity protein-like surface antigen
MKWSVLGGVALAVSLSSSAFADGYDRPAIYEPAFSWTGFYIGVHGGWENRLEAALPAGQTGIDRCHASSRWTVEWLNKLGVAFHDNRLLAYVTGGVAISDLSIERSRTITQAAPALTATLDWEGSSTAAGVVLGGGFQYALTNRVSLGLEYLHKEYASSAVNTKYVITNCSGTIAACSALLGTGTPNANGIGGGYDQFRTDTVRLVLDYKFGDPAPLK